MQSNPDIAQSKPTASGPYDLSFPDLDRTFGKLQAGQYSQDIEFFEQEKSLSAILQNRAQGFREFNSLDSIFSWHNSKEFLEECKECNIYSDVAPFYETAVVIKDASNKDLERDEQLSDIKFGQYINASYIKSFYKEQSTGVGGQADQPEVTPFGLIIATQGPKKNTVEHFWTMVL